MTIIREKIQKSIREQYAALINAIQELHFGDIDKFQSELEDLKLLTWPNYFFVRRGEAEHSEDEKTLIDLFCDELFHIRESTDEAEDYVREVIDDGTAYDGDHKDAETSDEVVERLEEFVGELEQVVEESIEPEAFIKESLVAIERARSRYIAEEEEQRTAEAIAEAHDKLIEAALGESVEDLTKAALAYQQAIKQDAGAAEAARETEDAALAIEKAGEIGKNWKFAPLRHVAINEDGSFTATTKAPGENQ